MNEAASAEQPELEGLPALNARLHRDLEFLNYPPPNWVVPRKAPGEASMHDVVIIGAGMCGITAAFQLLRHGIGNIAVLDQAPRGSEGPWVTYARMETLRSPKHLTGPAAGLPNLTFRAWYEAQWGTGAWDALDKIPRAQWMHYLNWYRDVLKLPVTNHARVTAVMPLTDSGIDPGFSISVDLDGGRREMFARKIVIATGREGLGRPRIPAVFAPYVGRHCWHTSDTINFQRFEGGTLAVVGWAASAVDNAATALEAGANRVCLIYRRSEVPRINKAKGIVYAGFTEGFPRLSHSMRIEMLNYIAACGVAAPRDSVHRLARSPGFELWLGHEVERVDATDHGLVLNCGHRSLAVDGVVLGTGFRIDVAGCDFLYPYVDDIATFEDLLESAEATAAGELARHPYLDDSFALIPRPDSDAGFLKDIHCFSHAATLSHGHVSSDIPAVSDGAQRLARGIAASLFVADAKSYERKLHDYVEPELLGDELNIDAWWPPLA